MPRGLRQGFVSVTERRQIKVGDTWIPHKYCYNKSHWVPDTNFTKNKYRGDGLDNQCKDCKREYTEKNNERIKWNRMYRNYGITKEEYLTLLEDQDGKCPICEQPLSEKGYEVSMDHCHNTKNNRGILCRMCNLGLGHFKDDPVVLQNAIEYLYEHRQRYQERRSDA